MPMLTKNLVCVVKEMFDYTVCKDNSPHAFKTICQSIEKNFPSAKKQKLLVDVDGSTIQTYTENGKDIDVYDDYDVGAVYIKSEIDLSLISNLTAPK